MRIALNKSLYAAAAVIAASSVSTELMAETPSGDSLFNVSFADIAGGPYIRAELGIAMPVYSGAFWLPPDYGRFDDVPQVFFDLSGENALGGAFAVGRDYMNGFRWDVSLTVLGSQVVSGPWSYTVPSTEGPHASIETTVHSSVVMANAFYSPLNNQHNISKLQPFITAGIGIANNEVGDWTRISSDPDNRTERTFEGASTSSFAWTIGGGVAWEVGEIQNRPIMFDVTYRYLNLGEARGGTTPVPGTGSGHSEPVQALTFDNSAHTVMFGIRIPLKSY